MLKICKFSKLRTFANRVKVRSLANFQLRYYLCTCVCVHNICIGHHLQLLMGLKYKWFKIRCYSWEIDDWILNWSTVQLFTNDGHKTKAVQGDCRYLQHHQCQCHHYGETLHIRSTQTQKVSCKQISWSSCLLFQFFSILNDFTREW